MLYRGGLIHCRGYLLDHRCAKIQRVCRSSLSAECHAAVTAGDYALRYQMILNEIRTHKHCIKKLCPPTGYTMLGPFTKSPFDAALKADKLFTTESEYKRNPAVKLNGELRLWNNRKCGSRQVCFPICTIESKYSIDSPDSKYDSPLFRPLLSTDCCSLFSSILRMQPNAQERCSRIILSHLRGLQKLLAISFVDASANSGDAGAKHGGNTALLYGFLRSRRFTISFVGRKEVIRSKKK